MCSASSGFLWPAFSPGSQSSLRRLAACSSGGRPDTPSDSSQVFSSPAEPPSATAGPLFRTGAFTTGKTVRRGALCSTKLADPWPSQSLSPDRSAQLGKARAWAPAGWGPCLGSPAQHRGRGWATWCLFTPNPTTESNFGDRGGSPCWGRRHLLLLTRLLGFLQRAIVFLFYHEQQSIKLTVARRETRHRIIFLSAVHFHNSNGESKISTSS